MFSQDCRVTVVLHSHDICTSVTEISHCKFAKNSRRQVRNTRTNITRKSCEIFWQKNLHKILNMFKTFATSSRHMKFSRHSCESRTNVTRNSATQFAKQSREIRMPVRYQLKGDYFSLVLGYSLIYINKIIGFEDLCLSHHMRHHM